MPPSWMKSTRTINLLVAAVRLPQDLDLPQPLDDLLLARTGQPTGCLLVVDSSHAQLPLQFLLLGQDHQLQAFKLLLLAGLLLPLANLREVLCRQAPRRECGLRG